MLWLQGSVYLFGAENSMVLTEKLLAETPQEPLITLPELPLVTRGQQHTVGARLQKVAKPVNRCNVFMQGITSFLLTSTYLPTQEHIMSVTHSPNAVSVKAGAQRSHCSPRHTNTAPSTWDRCTTQPRRCRSQVLPEVTLSENSSLYGQMYRKITLGHTTLKVCL